VTEADLICLKSNVNKLVEIETTDGEHLVGRVITVFDSEEDPDVWYDLISTSKPERYVRREENVGYSILLAQIASVKAIASLK